METTWNCTKLCNYFPLPWTTSARLSALHSTLSSQPALWSSYMWPWPFPAYISWFFLYFRASALPVLPSFWLFYLKIRGYKVYQANSSLRWRKESEHATLMWPLTRLPHAKAFVLGIMRGGSDGRKFWHCIRWVFGLASSEFIHLTRHKSWWISCLIICSFFLACKHLDITSTALTTTCGT